MGKTRQEKPLPTTQDTSEAVKTIDRMTGPVAVEATQRTQMGERLQAKRDAEQTRMFPSGIPQRMNTLPRKEADPLKVKDPQKLEPEDKRVMTQVAEAQKNPTASAAKMVVVPGGQVVAQGLPKEVAPVDKAPVHPPTKATSDGKEEKGKPQEVQPAPKAEGKDAPEANPLAEAKAEANPQAQVPSKSEAPGQDRKAPVQEVVKKAGQQTALRANKAAEKGAKSVETAKPVAQVKGAKGGPKGQKHEGEEKPELEGKGKGKPHGHLALGEGAGEGEGGKGGNDKDPIKEPSTEAVGIQPAIRGNFGEGQEPKLLTVNQVALLEFPSEAVLKRNADGTAIVLAGTSVASSESDLKGPESGSKRRDVGKAETTEIFTANRLQLQTHLSNFENRGLTLIAELQSAKEGIAGQINAGAETAKAAVMAAATDERAKIKSGFDGQKSAISGTSKSLKASTTSSANAKRGELRDDAKRHGDSVSKFYDTVDKALVAMQGDMVKNATNAFLKAPQDLVAVAQEEGKLAVEYSRTRANEFAFAPVPMQTTAQDILNGSDFEGDKYRARIAAANAVGDAHQAKYFEEAEKAGKLINGTGMMQFNGHVIDSIKLNRNTIKTLKEGALKEIDAQLQSALTAIDTSEKEACKTIEAAAKSGVNQLYTAEAKAQSMIDSLASGKIKAIDQTATSNTLNLEKQAQSSIDAIQAQVNDTITQISASNNPNAETIQAQLEQIAASLQNGHDEAMGLVTNGSEATIAGLEHVSTETAVEMAKTASASLEGAKKTGGSMTASIQNTFKGFETGAKSTTASTSKKMEESAKKANDGIKNQYDLVKKDLDEGYSKLIAKFDENTLGFRANLKTERAKLPDEITQKAEKAAADVQPRWVRWLLSAIDILVMIVITAVIMVALASGVGILGLLLIGALAGAIGGAIKYGAKVALTNEEFSAKGLAHAIIDGAIDGVKLAASMIPGWGIVAQIGVGAVAGGLKYGNDVLLGDKKWDPKALAINILMGGVDGAFNAVGNKLGKGFDKYMVDKFGKKAMETVGKKIMAGFVNDSINAIGDTLNGGVQNMLEMWSQGKGLDFKNFTDKMTAEAFFTNFAQSTFISRLTSMGGQKLANTAHTKLKIEKVDLKPGMAGYDPHEVAAPKKQDNDAPEVKAPEVKAPEVKAPEVKAPEVKAPEVKKPASDPPVKKHGDAPVKKNDDAPVKKEEDAPVKKQDEAPVKKDHEDAPAKKNDEAPVKKDHEDAPVKKNDEAPVKKDHEDAPAKKQDEAPVKKDHEDAPMAKKEDTPVKKDGEKGGEQDGGMMGKDVYPHAPEGKGIENLTPKDVFKGIMNGVKGGKNLGEGVKISPHGTDPNKVIMTMPDPHKLGGTKSIEVLINTKFDPTKVENGAHGDNQGAATNKIHVDAEGHVTVEIGFSGKHAPEDLPKMAAHELGEVHDIVNQLAKPSPEASHAERERIKLENEAKIKEQQSASVFKKDGSNDPSTMTAHDRQAVKELKTLLDEAKASSGPKRETAEKTLQKLAEEMGIKPGEGHDPSKPNEKIKQLEGALGGPLTAPQIAKLTGAGNAPDKHVWVRTPEGGIVPQKVVKKHDGPIPEMPKLSGEKLPNEIHSDQALKDKALGETAKKLMDEAAALRKENIIDPELKKGKTLEKNPELATTKNVAVGQLHLENGEPILKKATTQDTPMPIPPADNQVLKPSVDNKGTKANWEQGEHKPALNETHPEYKIYNETAADLQAMAKAQGVDVKDLKGTMVVYTEREMCSGCKNTASTGFETMFPGIKLIVIYSSPYETH